MSEARVGRGYRPYRARPVTVVVDGDGIPAKVGGMSVSSIRESWLVEEGWWSGDPLRRHYFELVTDCGNNLTVFRSIPDGDWFLQRA